MDDDIINQQDAAKFVFLIHLSLLYVFRETVSPTFGGIFTVYTASWTLLSAANR